MCLKICFILQIEYLGHVDSKDCYKVDLKIIEVVELINQPLRMDKFEKS